MTERPRALITGIGDGLGVGLAGAFARAGYDVVGPARIRCCGRPAARSIG